jgi:hypothetical protein
MRLLAFTVAFLVTIYPAHAGFAGFETGGGVALTGGVVRVNFMGNKSHSISLGSRVRLELMEVQLTMADGKIKRHCMIDFGTHTLRAPVPIEVVMILGPLCLLALVCAVAIALRSGLQRAEPGASPNGDPAMLSDNLGASGGPP